MKGYKYVEFSRSTAKKNPQMIVYEYELLINNINKSLYSYKKLEEFVEVDVFDIHNLELILEQIKSLRYSSIYSHDNPYRKIKIKFDSNELIRIINILSKRKSTISDLTVELQNLYRELNTFKKAFVWKE